MCDAGYFFKFRGKEHYVDFTSYGEALVMEPAVWKINELIKDMDTDTTRFSSQICG